MKLSNILWIGLAGCAEKETESTDTTQTIEQIDTDGDGLFDSEEEAFGSDPNNPDSDNDGLNDFEEQQNGTDPNNPDSDNDTLGDLEEMEGGTNPTNADSDGDGFDDAFEQVHNTDPNNPSEYPLFPTDGAWMHQNPQFTDDGCNLESILQEQGGSIFTFFPQNFDVSDSVPDSYTLTIEQSTSCTISNDTFICDRLYDAVDIETPNVTIDLEFAMEGEVIDSDAMDFSVEVRLSNCTANAAAACLVLGIAGIDIPCSSYISTQASP